MSRISVVMGTYNGSKYIDKQLSSILAQTVTPDEIIISDDGSTDDTLRIVQEIASKTAIPFRIHKNPVNLGFSDNFLSAAKLARSQYIAFADQDDIWLPTKLEKSLAALIDHQALLCAHAVTLIDAEGQELRLDTQGIEASSVAEPRTLDPWGVYFGFTQMFDSRLLNALPFEQRGRDNYNPDDVLPHDRWIFFLSSSLGRVVLLSEPLALYRQHGRNIYGIQRPNLKRRFLNKASEGARKLKQLEDIALHRAELWERSSDFPDRQAAALAAARWRHVARQCGRRHHLYTVVSKFGRIKALGGNILAGTYGSFASGGLGSKRFLEDVTLGLFAPR